MHNRLTSVIRKDQRFGKVRAKGDRNGLRSGRAREEEGMRCVTTDGKSAKISASWIVIVRNCSRTYASARSWRRKFSRK